MGNALNAAIFSQTLKWEREIGTSNNPNDKGGWTNDGITYKHYIAWCYQVLGRMPSDEHFKSMTAEEIQKFYKRIWERLGCQNIDNILLATVCFDFCFNSAFGKREIQEVLQKLNYSITADNVFGQQTYAALNTAFKKYGYDLIDLILIYRLQYVSELVYSEISQMTFIKGWTNRIFDLRSHVQKNI
jgi:lysozyme family protein